MHLELITPEKVVFKQDLDELIVQTQNGELAILPNHVNLVTALIPGEMIIKVKGKEQYLAVDGGFLEVANNKITVLADYAVRTEHIEAQKALEAQKRAEAVLKKSAEGVSEKDLAIAQGELRKSILQLKVAERRKRRTSIPQ